MKRKAAEEAPLSYQDLAGKILPELHLIAARAGIEDYKKLRKDDLVMALMEQEASDEGLKLSRGYLEIGPDGYGFLQENLYAMDSRSVIVSAGLIKQYQLRTGDFIVGKARPPRENERFGTLVRVEVVDRKSVV